jgi:hypothetical protein
LTLRNDNSRILNKKKKRNSPKLWVYFSSQDIEEERFDFEEFWKRDGEVTNE